EGPGRPDQARGLVRYPPGSENAPAGFLLLPSRFPGVKSGKRRQGQWFEAERENAPSAGNFPALIVVVDLVEQAPALRLERSVVDARRPAGIGRRVEGLAALSLRIIADNEVARDQVDLFPMVVHERRRGVDARLDAQKPGAAAHLPALVDVARENF